MSKSPGMADLEQLFGELEPRTGLEILKLKPSFAELEEAATWLTGTGDALARQGRPQSQKIQAILEILDTDREEDRR